MYIGSCVKSIMNIIINISRRSTGIIQFKNDHNLLKK